MTKSVPATIKSVPGKGATSSPSKTNPDTKDRSTKQEPIKSLILPRPKTMGSSGTSNQSKQDKDKTTGGAQSLLDRLKRSPLPSRNKPQPITADKTPKQTVIPKQPMTKPPVYTLVVPRPTVPASHLTKPTGSKIGNSTSLLTKPTGSVGKSLFSLSKPSTSKSCSSLDKTGLRSPGLFDRIEGRDAFSTGFSSGIFKDDLLMSNDPANSGHVTRTVTRQTHDGSGVVQRRVDIKVTQHTTSSNRSVSMDRLKTFDQPTSASSFDDMFMSQKLKMHSFLDSNRF